ncbi:MAG: hypothetical protein AB1584_21190 [Pseudomonadota bacterium]
MDKFLKIFAHSQESANADTFPFECTEISLQATPEALRQIAEFILSAAARLEALPVSQDAHFHLQDEWEDWQFGDPDVVVVSAPSSSMPAPEPRGQEVT